ncbi:MAG: hypothetical protein Q8P46_06605 [Hyphomicrobiales bacterium]|nr:hypothetical protein [Hyphomicrobiales bacterium]
MPSTATDTRAETSAATDKPARKSAGEDIRIIDVGHDETAARAFQES